MISLFVIATFLAKSLHSGCIPDGLCLDQSYSGVKSSTEYKCNEDGTTSEIRYDGLDCNVTNDHYAIGSYGDDGDIELGYIKCDGSCQGYVKWREYKPKYATCDHYGGYSEFVAPLGCTSFEESGTSVKWFCDENGRERERLSFGFESYTNVNCEGNYTAIQSYRGGKCSTGYATDSYSYMDLYYCGYESNSGAYWKYFLSCVISVMLVFPIVM